MGVSIAPDKNICQICKHYTGQKYFDGEDGLEGDYLPVCKAFPEGIPDEILEAENKHLKPLPDQGNKVVFEPIEEKK